MSAEPLAHPIAHRYGDLLDALTSSLCANWRSETYPAGPVSWLVVRHRGRAVPTQGWKIHLSVTASEALDLAGEILPRLVGHAAPVFKVPANLDSLLILNSGLAGATQVGKILTIFPESADSAQDIVALLQKEWPHTGGPHVLSDLRVDGEAPVYLRYGSFLPGPASFDRYGKPLSVLRNTLGEPVPDTRTLTAEQPVWAPPPPAGVVTGSAPGTPRRWAAFGTEEGEHIIVDNFAARRTPDVAVAVDTATIRLVVVKRARRGVKSDATGRDAMSRLANEYARLETASRHRVPVPAPISYRSDLESSTLVLEHLDGQPLDSVSRTRLRPALIRFSHALRSLHAAGIVHRDVKLSNAMLVGTQVYLLDLELAAEIGATDVFLAGTNGYVPPEGSRAPGSVAGDRFAFGATVFEALTGMTPSQLPLDNNRGRMLGLLQLAGLHAGASLVRRLTSTDPTDRPPLEHAERDLARMPEFATVPMAGRTPRGRPGHTRQARAFDQRAAHAAGLACRRYAVPQEHGVAWRNDHLYPTHLLQGINIGAAGIVLGLTSLNEALGTSDFTADLRGGATWLASTSALESAHGLFTGNAGVAIALAVAGRRCAEPGWLTAARRRLEIAGRQTAEFDLFSGSAGIIWSSAVLASIAGDEWLDYARPQVDLLDRHVEESGGIPCWRPVQEDGSRADANFGAAHGSAGVALGLAVWGRQAGSPRATDRAATIFAALLRAVAAQDSPVLPMPADRARSQKAILNWCHGTAGLVWCLLESGLDLSQFADELSACLGSLLDHCSIFGNPTYCHGLAGRLELLRMIDNSWPGGARVADLRARCRAALRLLYQRNGRGGWGSENPGQTSPDLWVGYLGPATSLAVEHVEGGRSVLSPGWLRRCAAPT